jgi:2'-5' RNA ligase
MKYFLGIVPPDSIYTRLLQIQRAHGDNRLEPHITLRPPVSLVHADQWIQTIANIAAAFKPFQVVLPGTGNFGKRVLFVSVCSDPLGHLYDLLIPALKPFEVPQGVERFAEYHPHLTLGRSWCGFTVDDFRKMRELADEYLAEGNIAFTVNSIRIYHKPDAHGGYRTFSDVPLSPMDPLL